MSAPTVLTTIDVNAAKQQASASYQSKTGPSTFDSVLNTASYAAGVMGPVATESVFAATGNMQTTSIVSAAMNATAGGGYGSPLGLQAGAMGGIGGTNYLTGGAGPAFSGLPGGSAGGGASGNVESIINQSYMNQSYLLAVQAELGNIQTQTTSLSNALNVKDGAMRSVINNFRVG